LRSWQHWLVISLSSLLACLLALSTPGQKLDSAIADLLFEWRGPLPPPAEIVIVKIDDPSLAELNLRWPWPRTLHAKLLDALFQAGAKVVVFDLVFAEPAENPSADNPFAEALQRYADVILASHLDEETNIFGKRTTWTLPLADFIIAPDHVGFANLTQSGGVVRSFTAITEGHASLAYSAMQAFVAHFPDQYENHDIAELPAQIYINFAGPAGSLKSVAYYQALQPAAFLPADYFKNKLVFVGAATNIGGGDSFAVPGSDSLMYGVEIHANATANLIHQNYLRHPGPMTMLVSGLFSGLLSGLLLLRLGLRRALVLLTVSGVLMLAAIILLFSYQAYSLPLALVLFPVTGVFIAFSLLRKSQ
jgi:adenylate cyclase